MPLSIELNELFNLFVLRVGSNRRIIYSNISNNCESVVLKCQQMMNNRWICVEMRISNAHVRFLFIDRIGLFLCDAAVVIILLLDCRRQLCWHRILCIAVDLHISRSPLERMRFVILSQSAKGCPSGEQKDTLFPTTWCWWYRKYP